MRARIVKFCLALQAAVFLLALLVDATLDPIVIAGSHFFFKTNGSEFFIRGVAYPPAGGEGDSFVDVLADQASCVRDIPYLQELRTNLVRVYAIDSTQDHSACMTLLDSAGIYVLVDLSTPALGITRDDPVWNAALYASYTAAVDSMQSYTNVLGFFVGNEVIDNATNSNSAAFVKAAVRDMKSYIQAKGYRSIGVGYASDDDASILSDLEDYMNCGDAAASIDFLGLNVYSWCGDSSYTESGYSELTNSLSDYSVPVFLAEYGCNTVGGAAGRTFSEVQAIYGSQMTGVFSGGIVFEFLEDTNDFGLVSISGNSVSTMADFKAFSTQMASASPSSTPLSAYTPTNTATRSCPATGSTWLASETLPPSPNSDLCDCMYSSLSCVAAPGINGSDIGTLLEQSCGADPTGCDGIAANATAGKYGAYSVCNSTQQVSWALNQQYLRSTDCDFGGLAQIHAPLLPVNQCAELLDQAGTQGTGTISSPSSTGTGTSTGTSSSKSSTGTGTSAGGGGPARSSGGGLSTGAKVGIAIAAILVVAALAGLGIYFLRRKRKTKDAPLSGEGGLEVGDAPPEMTALRRAELGAQEADKPHVISGELMGDAAPVHDIQVHGNELDASRERQELESTGAPLQPRRSELDAAASVPELSDANAASRGELSRDSTRGSELSPKRKPLSSSTSPKTGDDTAQQPTSESWSNRPWSNPGMEGFAVAHPGTHEPASAAEADELRRIEEEERRIDEAIAESERLQALRKQKEELQKRKSEMMARSGGGPGSSSTAPS